MKGRVLIALCVWLTGLAVGMPGPSHAARAQAAAAPPAQAPATPGQGPRFESAIAAFLEADRINPPPKGAILFIGSSIFRQWTDLAAQMAPLPVFNRAFGGSRASDLLDRMDQIVLPYAPRIIVYYAGSNDINAGARAAEVFERVRRFSERVSVALPETRLFFVSINRAPQKRDRWDIVDAANALVRDYCSATPRRAFIDVNPVLFADDGTPRLDRYQTDQLHLLAPAYEGFAAIIRPVLEKAWAEVAPATPR